MSSCDRSLPTRGGRAITQGTVIVTEATGSDLTALRYHTIQTVRIASHEAFLARTAYTGEDGFEVCCRPERADVSKKINSAVFPGQQAGPLEHVIVAKGVSFRLAATADYRDRQQRAP